MNHTKKEIRNKAFQYYCKGLTSKEIGKLLDLSFRTIQGYMQKDNWKTKRNPTPIKLHAYNLHEKGLSYTAIAQSLNVSNATIYNWIKQIRKSIE